MWNVQFVQSAIRSENPEPGGEISIGGCSLFVAMLVGLFSFVLELEDSVELDSDGPGLTSLIELVMVSHIISLFFFQLVT